MDSKYGAEEFDEEFDEESNQMYDEVNMEMYEQQNNGDEGLYLDESQFNHTKQIPDESPYHEYEYKPNDYEQSSGNEYTESPLASDFKLRQREPLKFLKGLQKGGLPFFAFEPVTYDDIIYEINLLKYKKSLPTPEPGYLKSKKSSRKHVSSCICSECKKSRSKRSKELVKAMYFARKGNPILIAATMRKNGFLESKNPNEWNICWSLESLLVSDIKLIKAFQKINMLPKIAGIVLKDELYQNISF